MGIFRGNKSRVIRTPLEYNKARSSYCEKTVFDYDIVAALAEGDIRQRFHDESEYIAKQEQVLRILKAKQDFIIKFHQSHADAYERYPNLTALTCRQYENLCYIGKIPAWELHSVVAPISWKHGCFAIGTDGSIYLGNSIHGHRNVDDSLHDYTVEQLTALADLIEAYVNDDVLHTIVRLMTKGAVTYPS